MFVRVSVNKVGVPKQMILTGICERCAAKDDATLLREGCADLRRAFPDMPEFEMQVERNALGDGRDIGGAEINMSTLRGCPARQRMTSGLVLRQDRALRIRGQEVPAVAHAGAA